MHVLSDAEWAELEQNGAPENYLFLEPHSNLKYAWQIEGEDPMFQARMERVVSRFGTVSVWDYEAFVAECEIQGYEPVFVEDPRAYFEWIMLLGQDPGVEVESKLEGRLDRHGEPLKLIRGFLPFQATGINFMRQCERCVYFNWSTGTGKTLAAEGTILAKRQEGFALTLYVVKPSNLFNTQAKLHEHTGLESTILTGTPSKRMKTLAAVDEAIERGEQPILIMNAEKLRDDKDAFMMLVEGRSVLTIFDEMPEKYSNRDTALYRATAEVFYTSFSTPPQGKNAGQKVFYPKAGKDRTSKSFFVAMCATPIRTDPEGVFNCIRMMDSTIYGGIDFFNNLFVAARDQFWRIIKWKNLDFMGAMASHVVHQADKKKDPAIAAQFPEVLPPEIDYCDIDPVTERLYSVLLNELRSLGASVLDFDEVLAAIGCLQMLCNNPQAVLDSSIRYETYLCEVENDLPLWMKLPCYYCRRSDNGKECRHPYVVSKPKAKEVRRWHDRHKHGSEVALKLRTLVDDDSKFTDRDSKGNLVQPKLIKLYERLQEHGDKTIVFCSLNEMGLPYITEWFDVWGISYVTYHGGLTAKQKQEAQDAFRTNPDIQVFLGTDAGKDSIDLPEADLTIHYDEPWSWAGLEQRENRQHRIDSEKQSVQTVTLRIPNTVEDRKAQVIARKKGYHDQVFGGDIADQAEELSKADFEYILFG